MKTYIIDFYYHAKQSLKITARNQREAYFKFQDLIESGHLEAQSEQVETPDVEIDDINYIYEE